MVNREPNDRPMKEGKSDDHPEYFYYAPSQAILCFEYEDANWFMNPEKGHRKNQFDDELIEFLKQFQKAEIIPKPLDCVSLFPPVRLSSPNSNTHIALVQVRWPSSTNIAQVVKRFNRLLGKDKLATKQDSLQANALPAKPDTQFTFDLYDPNRRRLKGTLKHVVLNWYMGAASCTTIGSHGPGKPPRPVINNDMLDGLQFVFSQDFENELATCKGGPPVDVYVLDTVPSIKRIRDAWKNWGSTTLEKYKRILAPLVKKPTDSLIYRTEKATYYYTDPRNFEDTTRPRGDEPGPHALVLRDRAFDDPHLAAVDHTHGPDESAKHDTSDHGLFIAGIIHDIAPEAHIHVIEVLNEFGIGTFLTLMQGFATVIELQRDRPNHASIINCSLTLSFPTPDHRGYRVEPDDFGLYEFIQLVRERLMDAGDNPVVSRLQNIPELLKDAVNSDVVNQLRNIPEFLDGVRAELDNRKDEAEQLFDQAAASIRQNDILLSASGNDSDRENADPNKRTFKEARYLAKTDFSAGVGALKKDNTQAAEYSNKADEPGPRGFMVFGGDYEVPPQLEYKHGGILDYKDSGKGIIGIYTGDFPVNPGIIFPNQNGFAEWAGTSFATPIIAGVIARVCYTCNMSPLDAGKFIRKAPFSEPDRETGSDKFLAIEQKTGH